MLVLWVRFSEIIHWTVLRRSRVVSVSLAVPYFQSFLFSGPVDPPSGFQWVRLAWTNRPLSANAFLPLASSSQDEVKSSAKSSQLAAAPIAAPGGPGKNQRAVLWRRPSMAAKEISIRAIFFLNYFDAVSFRLSSCRLLSCVLSAFIVRFPLGLRRQLRRISLGPQTVPSVDEEIEGWGKGVEAVSIASWFLPATTTLALEAQLVTVTGTASSAQFVLGSVWLAITTEIEANSDTTFPTAATAIALDFFVRFVSSRTKGQESCRGSRRWFLLGGARLKALRPVLLAFGGSDWQLQAV